MHEVGFIQNEIELGDIYLHEEKLILFNEAEKGFVTLLADVKGLSLVEEEMDYRVREAYVYEMLDATYNCGQFPLVVLFTNDKDEEGTMRCVCLTNNGRVFSKWIHTVYAGGNDEDNTIPDAFEEHCLKEILSNFKAEPREFIKDKALIEEQKERIAFL